MARGSGTGLSGGALPHQDGVLIVMSRMRSIVEIDPVSRRAVVEPGVTNLAVSKAAAPFGLFYAPDPSSQVVCSVGGNVAENSGGAHCLKHGFTVHHVTGLQIVTPAGELTWLGDGTGVSASGYDLVGAFTGSEGTLGVVTKIVVKLMPLPQVVHTLLAAYATTAEGGRAVSDIIAAGVMPAAIEMMDALSIEAAEAAVHCNYPAGAGAVLIVELDGPAAEVEAELTTVRSICEKAGATEIRAADDPAERAVIWAGRKSAFAAVGRISPSFIVQDGVVPRTSLGAVLARIASLSEAAGIRVANVFHAGDGNLHPLVLYDDAMPWPGGRGRGGVRPDPGRVPGTRRLDHRRARRRGGQVPVHAEDVQPGRPGHHAAAALRVRPGQPVQPGQGVPHAPAVRRGPRPPPGAPSGRRGRAGGDLLMDTERAVVPAVRDALVAACPVVREADPALDAVAGVPPSFVASPGSTDEASALAAGRRGL